MISDFYLLILVFLIHFTLYKNKKKIFSNYFLDMPNVSRKIHKEPTYLLGGHFIFISYSVFLLFSFDYSLNHKFVFFFIFSCIFLMKRDGKYCETINDLTGISKHHPILSISLLIILFSLAGIPPLAGFFAKFYIFMSVIESKMYALAIIGLLSTVISAFYYLRIIKTIYFDETDKPFDEIKNLSISITLFLSSFILISFFIYPSFLNNVVKSLLIY